MVSVCILFLANIEHLSWLPFNGAWLTKTGTFSHWVLPLQTVCNMHIGTFIFCSHCIWFFIASSLCLRCPGFVYWLFGFCPHPEWRQYFPCPNLALITIDHAFQIPVDVTPQLCSLWQTLDCRNYGNNYQQICNNEDTFWRLVAEIQQGRHDQ